MPPKNFDKSLTKEEKELLKAWVLSGGKYAEHWAFVKPLKGQVQETPLIITWGKVEAKRG